MGYDQASLSTVEFARRVKGRILGNHDDQRICFDQPSRVYDFGILFARSDAEANRRGDRSIFKPNAITVRFEVAKETLNSLRLDICPSFWLYFRRAPGEEPPPEWADRFDARIIWSDWQGRAQQPQGAYSPKQWVEQTGQGLADEQREEEGARPFIRKRYTRSYTGSLPELSHLTLDLEAFREGWRWLGDRQTPRWKGYIEVVHRDGSSSDRRLVEIRLVNDYRYSRRYGLRGEPAWFDARLKVKVNTRVLPIYCPLLGEEYDGLRVQTVNCVLDQQESRFTESTSVILVDQVGQVIRHRRTMRPASSFVDAAAGPARLLRDARRAADAAEAEDPDHATALRRACDRIEGDEVAMKALAVVAQTFGRAFAQRSASHWHLHQTAILALAAASYLDGGTALQPLVINVPTAGGKSEAFVAVAFWTVAYEAFSGGRMGTAIIKYPTTMLSDDQANRLARYVMEFDVVMAQHLQEYRPRGLGLFFGPDESNADPTSRVGKKCPVCGELWTGLHMLDGQRGRKLTCPNGHSLHVSIHDEVFYMRPALIVSTLHKFVAKSLKGVMRTLLGGQGYWCHHRQQVTNKSCCWLKKDGKWRKLPHQPARERTLVSTLVLDEAHLIREDIGALAAHFETHYLEMVRKLGGRYPLVLVSTATIAHVEHHTFQLGLGRQPIVFPGKESRNEGVYYEPTGQVHHVILACIPRGRAISWAVPHLVGDYIDIAETHPAKWKPFVPTMVYCPSYLTRDQVSDGIRRHVNDPRRTKGRSELTIEEFSRQRFTVEGQDAVLKRLRDQEIQVVLSTNIASVGVDLPNLNSIIYFGVPLNISEFIQSLNRVARRVHQPGVAFLVLDPYKERDNSYYTYLEPFALFPHRVVEAIPLDRYARRAIDQTFDTIAMAQISHWWRSRVRGFDISRCSDFKAARGRQLSDTRVVPLLSNTFRAESDPSGVYPSRVRSLWASLAKSLERGGRFIWDTQNLNRMWRLVPQQPQGTLMVSPEAEALRKANVRAVYGLDRTESGNLSDEEFGLTDGASEDIDLGE